MQVRKLFGIYDAGVDGRMTPVLKGVYATEAQAAAAAGVYRSVSPVWGIGPTSDGACWYLLQQPQPVLLGADFDRQREEAKLRALAKLSPEERAALGLKE